MQNQPPSSQQWQQQPYPPQQPYQPYGQPPPPFQPPPQTSKKRRRRWPWIVGGLIVVLIIIIVAANSSGNGSGQQVSVTPTTAATSAPTQPPTPTTAPTQPPTPTPQTVHYPPKTKADLQELAAQGDASNLSVIDSQSVGLTGVCPQPRVDALVSTAITGEQLDKDMLAYFYSQNMNSPCGSVLFVYYSKADYDAGNGYTAGRILLDTTDASGQSNTDPNATNITYTLTLDNGSFGNSQEYVVTYGG